MTDDMPWDSMVAALLLTLLMVFVWGWQRGVKDHTIEELFEPWQHVREHYPIPGQLREATELSAELLQQVVRANPFSPARQQASSKGPGTESGQGASAAPLPPQFLYKGRVMIGQTQRAVIEETTAKKTYFLQVGQEVAGFKVLDMTESQVVLSDPQTGEEVAVSLATSTTPSPSQAP